jgi:PhoPQ-activated pathogenicity-related protein
MQAFRSLLNWLVLPAIVSVSALSAVGLAQTALDTYVAAPDASYSYNLVATQTGPGYTAYTVDMKSQTWRSPTEITNPADLAHPNLWQHYLTIVKPDTIHSNTALLQVGAGNNGGGPPGINPSLLALAMQTGSITAELGTVPNQPLQFTGEAFTRIEDQIISKTFRTYLDGGDDQWPLLLPMVKSAVRAMDTVQNLIGGQGGTVADFVVTGGSKRGWTTWLTAAVDDRVRAIAPVVIDVLQLDQQMEHHKEHYIGTTAGLIDGYAEAIGDYVAAHVVQELGTPRGQQLLASIDPYSYLDRLDMPKYIVNATGDQYFVPDSSQFYFHDLAGSQNYLRYVPNAEHGLNADARAGVDTYYGAVLAGTPLPTFSWTTENGGQTIQVQTTAGAGPSLLGVKLWQATNPQSRDFRLGTVGPIWSSTTLGDQGGGHYVGQVTTPRSGATAMMVELTYDVGGKPLVFTTDVSIVGAENLLVNGDFTANAAAFTKWPGYVDLGDVDPSNPNPASITGWLNYFNSPGQGVNGAGAATSVGNPFGPTNTGDRTYAFLQNGGSNLLGQYLPSLAVNTTYELSLDVAGRAGNPAATFKVLVAGDDTATPVYLYDSGIVAANTAAFTSYTVSFTTPATFSGSPNLQLWNTSPAGDNTVVFANAFLVAVSGIAGDYNNNGAVDAADYVLWRGGGPLYNDTATLGVQPGDYDVWKANFGQPGPGAGSGSSLAAAVPEPASALLILCSLVGLCVARRR